MRLIVGVAAAITLVGPLAAAPVLRELQPRGAQRGKTFTLRLRGEGLSPGSKIETTLPAGISRMLPTKDPALPLERPGSELPYLIELKADAPIGVYPIRIVTDDGLSNALLFAVGDLPETDEAEARPTGSPNNTIDKAQAIQSPAVVNGTLPGADVDFYSVQATAGQKLVFELEARRAGSAVDPALEILDAAGRVIAKNDDAPGIGSDARLEFAFPKAGQYFVRVHDSKYSDQPQNFYRLKVGMYPYADGLFPLGWRRGEEVEVSLVGGNLARDTRVKAIANGTNPLAPIHLPGSASLPLWFAWSDQPETIEPEAAERDLGVGVIMNGRISRPGEIDRYRLAVVPGEQWMIELAAAVTGASQLDALVTIYDALGKKLASRDDVGGVDPALPFTAPDGAKEIVIAIEDLQGRGGPAFAYRLQAKRSAPDFTAELLTPFANVPAGGTTTVAVQIQRRGYDGALRVRIPDLPPGFHVAGGNVPSEAAAQDFKNDNAGFRTARTTLTITADMDIAPQSGELVVLAEADLPTGKIVRIARGPGILSAVRGTRQSAVTAPWLGWRLPIAIAKPLPVSLVAASPLVRMAQGFEYTMDYRIRRRPGARPTGRVREQIAGAVGNLRILQGAPPKNPDSGSLLVATNFASPITTFDLLLETQTEVDGKTVTISSPAISVEVVPGYRIEPESLAHAVGAGSRWTIKGKLYREPTFEGALVRLRVEDLPENARCDAAEVAEGQSDFELRCEAGADVKPGNYEFRITSAAPDVGRKAKDEYKIADLPARLTVRGAEQAARQ